MELSKPQRLISILILLARKRGNAVTIREIKDHLERNSDETVNIRALQRDMSDLIDIPNVPVQVQGSMRTGYSYFIASPGFSRALAAPFTASEAMADTVFEDLDQTKASALDNIDFIPFGVYDIEGKSGIFQDF